MKRLLTTLAILFSLCGSSFAANEVIYSGESALTGQTLYFTLKAGSTHASVGQYWNGAAFATYTATRATWDVAMTEVGVTGDFTGTLPASATGAIIVKVYQDFDDNGTPDHEDDILLETQMGYWNGTKFYL